jgi:hypothetical protein
MSNKRMMVGQFLNNVPIHEQFNSGADALQTPDGNEVVLASTIGNLSDNPIPFLADPSYVTSGGAADTAFAVSASATAQSNMSIYAKSNPAGIAINSVTLEFADTNGDWYRSENVNKQSDILFAYPVSIYSLRSFDRSGYWETANVTNTTTVSSMTPAITGQNGTFYRVNISGSNFGMGYPQTVTITVYDDQNNQVGTNSTAVFNQFMMISLTASVSNGDSVSVNFMLGGAMWTAPEQYYESNHTIVPGHTAAGYAYKINLANSTSVYIGKNGLAYQDFPALVNLIAPGDANVGVYPTPVAKSLVNLLGRTAPDLAFYDNKKSIYEMLDVVKAKLAAKEPANTNIQAHILNTNNPHGVTPAQIGAVPSVDVGVPGGIAILDENGFIESSQIPTTTVVTTSEKGAANGIATLDENGVLPVDQLPSSVLTTNEKGAVNGVATLDENGKLTSGQLPVNVVTSDEKGTANGIATLDQNGKLSAGQIPSVNVADTHVVTSQNEMLALQAQPGDIAVRTDTNKTFMLQGSDPSVLANWIELLTPTNITVGQIQGIGDSASRNVGTTTGTVCAGDDARLSDSRTPLAHNHPVGEVTGLGAAATMNVGSTAGTVCAGNDSRLSDLRTPLAHLHAGSDIVSAVATATTATTATTAETANKIRMARPASPQNGDIWME